MKHLIFIFSALLLFSCGPKTAENSKYSGYIADLSKLHTSLDSSYSIFSIIDNDSLKEIGIEANKKYEAVKSMYKSDTINSKLEVIMLTARGTIYKKVKKYLSDYDAVNKEYEYSTKQYKTLRERLIHEKMNESDALNYTIEEKNAMILLNGEMKGLTDIANQTFSTYGNIFFQLDSIIELYDEI
ncbi:MAG: hypothetical protein ACI8RY_000763 [Urechidicola sp.]|jgi:hypothetical protein